MPATAQRPQLPDRTPEPPDHENRPKWTPWTGCRFVGGEPLYDALGSDAPPDGWPYPRPTLAEVAATFGARRRHRR